MKILVLNGSPKRDKSDTMHLTRAFLAGMSDAAPQDVKKIDVIDKSIAYCTGCLTCMHNGGTCIHDDDMAGILTDILSTDVLLLSFPLYCYGMPAPLKAVIDRILPVSTHRMEKVGDRYEHPSEHDVSHLKYVMICGCGFPNSRHNFEAVVTQFHLLFGEEDSTILTIPESPMFNAPEAKPVTEPFLTNVRRAGREFAEQGRISEQTMAALSVPMIPEDVYARICNGDA